VSVTRATCPLDCPDACGVLVHSDAEGRFEKLTGNPEHGWSAGHLCSKTMAYGEIVNGEQRLLRPLVRRGGKKSAPLEPASWDEALARIAERVRPLEGQQVLALWYAGTMGLVQRKYPLRVMHALGATLHDGGVCDATATAGFECVLGRCLGPDLETELEDCDLLLLWGCEMARTNQHLQPRVKRLLERGVPVVAIDIWRSDTIQRLERWGGQGLVVKPGSDALLALALARIAFELGIADREFLARECLGADLFEAHVTRAHDLEQCQAGTGLDPQAVAALAMLLRGARKPIIKTGVGFARRRNGGMSMRAVCSLAAVLGQAQRVHYESFAHFGLREDWIVRPDLRPAGASAATVPHVQLGRMLDEGRFRAVFVWCHNPAVVLPDSSRVRRGLAREDVFTVVHEHVLTETAELADVVLPATTFVEHEDVYRSYGHRRLQWTRPGARPRGEAQSNVECFRAIARVLGLPRAVWELDAQQLVEGFLEASGERIRADELAALREGKPVKLHEQRFEGWGTPSGKVELANPAPASYVPDDNAGQRGAFQLIPAPSVATHNSTYLYSGRHAAKAGQPVCHLHPADLERLNAGPGARLVLSNAQGRITLPASADANVPEGCIRVDGVLRGRDVPEGVGINALVSPMLSDIGDGNVLYSMRVDAWISA
jgi:anaerobic selenocysteine-containing dehydrogenase